MPYGRQHKTPVTFTAKYKIVPRGGLYALVEVTTGNVATIKGSEFECEQYAKRIGLPLAK